MHVWPSIVMMARCKSAAGLAKVKNGMRYKLLSIDNDIFVFAYVTDEGEDKGCSFELSKEEVATTMRLTHAITYFSSQARTIHGSLRLVNTRSPKFDIRHLIVGLGRAPNGCDVQVV